MHALVIENHFFIATMVEDELRDLGYDSIEVVDSEQEAIAAAAQCCPDLITADQRLASGTGVEAIRTICEQQPIPVVSITGYGEEVRELIPDAVVLAKPFVPRLLREAVEQAIAVIEPGLDAKG